MSYSADIERILSKKGQIATITTMRDMRMRKGQPTVQKMSTFQCRLGVNYDNIAVVGEKRTTGELPSDPQPLAWGEWLEFPYLITHNNQLYVKCTPLHNNNTSKTKFLLDGYEISKDVVKPMCLSSEFSETRTNDAFTIKASSIIEIT